MLSPLSSSHTSLRPGSGSIDDGGIDSSSISVLPGKHQGWDIKETDAIPIVGGKTKLLGMEFESKDLVFRNADYPLKKGGVIAKTVGSAHGYPIISLTVEDAYEQFPVLEVVTAPLSLESHKHLQVCRQCEIIFLILSSIEPGKCMSLTDIVDWYNSLILNNDLLKDSLTLEINHEPASLRNDRGLHFSNLSLPQLKGEMPPGIFLNRLESTGMEVVGDYFRQTSFFIPYKNVSNLGEVSPKSECFKFFDGDRWRDSRQGVIFLSRVLGLKSIDENTRSAFIHWFYNCNKIINFALSRESEEKAKVIRCVSLSVRVSSHQEIMELMSDEDVCRVISTLLNDVDNRIHDQIEKYLLGEDKLQDHIDINKLKCWLSLELNQLVNVLRIRYIFGRHHVHEPYSLEPYITTAENRRVKLANYASGYLSGFLINQPQDHNEFVYKLEFINEKPYCVVEFRLHQGNGGGRFPDIPFNDPQRLFDPSNPTVAEQEMMDFLFKEDVNVPDSDSVEVNVINPGSLSVDDSVCS